MNDGVCNFIFSYPGEFALFVEHCASILKRYMGEKRTFLYVSGDSKEELEAFYEKLEAFVDSGEKVRVIILCQDEKLVPAQMQESKKWAGIKSNTLDDSDRLSDLFVNIRGDRLNRKLGRATVDPPKSLLTQSSQSKTQHEPNLYTVSDLDRSSAERLAEHLLREAMGLPPISSSAKKFTYEKNIIEFYRDLLAKTECTSFSDLPEGELAARIEVDIANLNEGEIPALPEDEIEIKREFQPGTKWWFRDAFEAGVPMAWPSVRVRTDAPPSLDADPSSNEEITEKIGTARPGLKSLELEAEDLKEEPAYVYVSALTKQRAEGLRFLEAGPRAKVRKFHQIAIVVSGGIAPGINAVIDGIVQRHYLYDNDCKVHAFNNGFFGVLHNTKVQLDPHATSENVSLGGSMIGTHRLDRLDTGPGGTPRAGATRLRDRIKAALEDYDALYVIGGDGSMKMVNMLLPELRGREKAISVVGIPKTMDNDILWVWQTFGFATAVEKARDVINCLAVEKTSNPRVCIVQLFGSVSGFVVSHAVLACQSGVCNVALIPEVEFSVKDVAECIRAQCPKGPAGIPEGLIVMAETAIPKDWRHYLADAELTTGELRAVKEYQGVAAGDFLDGQTPDALRSASLKILQTGLQTRLQESFGDRTRVFSNEPRHILRSAHPSFSDIIFGQRLGALAVDNALAGYSDFMVSQWLTEFVMVPLGLVAIGRKRIYGEGMFWKSVLAKTGQAKFLSHQKRPPC